MSNHHKTAPQTALFGGRFDRSDAYLLQCLRIILFLGGISRVSISRVSGAKALDNAFARLQHHSGAIFKYSRQMAGDKEFTIYLSYS